MKKLFFILSLIFAVGFQSFAQNNNDNDDADKTKFEIVNENRNLPVFESIDITGRFKVVLHQSTTQTVTVVAPDKFMSIVSTTVENGILKINITDPPKDKDVNFFEKMKLKHNDYLIRQPIEIHIGVNNLKQIIADGASTIETKTNFDIHELYINLSEASKATLECNISDLTLSLSEAAKLEMTGKVQNIQLDASGAANFKGGNLQSKNVTVNMSGASRADVFASESLHAKLNGASTLYCYGSPKDVHQTTSRVSKIVIN